MAATDYIPGVGKKSPMVWVGVGLTAAFGLAAVGTAAALDPSGLTAANIAQAAWTNTTHLGAFAYDVYGEAASSAFDALTVEA